MPWAEACDRCGKPRRGQRRMVFAARVEGKGRLNVIARHDVMICNFCAWLEALKNGVFLTLLGFAGVVFFWSLRTQELQTFLLGLNFSEGLVDLIAVVLGFASVLLLMPIGIVGVVVLAGLLVGSPSFVRMNTAIRVARRTYYKDKKSIRLFSLKGLRKKTQEKDVDIDWDGGSMLLFRSHQKGVPEGKGTSPVPVCDLTGIPDPNATTYTLYTARRRSRETGRDVGYTITTVTYQVQHDLFMEHPFYISRRVLGRRPLPVLSGLVSGLLAAARMRRSFCLPKNMIDCCNGTSSNPAISCLQAQAPVLIRIWSICYGPYL